MKGISDYRADVLTILGDETGRRFSENILDMGLSQALETYRKYCPKKETIIQRVAGIDGNTVTINFPIDPAVYILAVRDESGQAYDFADYRSDHKLLLTLYNSSRMPAVDTKLQLELSVPHKIKGLDSASQTTVPDSHCLIVCSGAAGFAMRIRARSVTEVFGKRPEDREALAAQAEVLISDFERDLAGIQAAVADPLPRGGFPI